MANQDNNKSAAYYAKKNHVRLAKNNMRRSVFDLSGPLTDGSNVTIADVAATFGVAISAINTAGLIGAGPYSLVSGYDRLPQGITLNTSTGVVSGTPTDPRGWGWHVIKVRSAAGNIATFRMCSAPDLTPANYDVVYNGTVISTATTLQNLTNQKLLILNPNIDAVLTLRNIVGSRVVIAGADVDSSGDGIRLSYQGNVENLTIWNCNINAALNGIIAESEAAVTHPGLRVFNNRIIDTGSAGGGSNLHGMYIEARGAHIAGNVIGPDTDFPTAAGMRNGNGVSVRSSAIVVHNKIKKCFNSGVGYYASADAADGALEVRGNDISDVNISNTGRYAIDLLGLGGDAPIENFIGSALIVDNGTAEIAVDPVYNVNNIPVVLA